MTTPTALSASRNLAILILAVTLELVPLAPPAAAELSPFRATLFSEGYLFLLQPANNDEFAHALAVGDFDGDGVDDLATAIPNDDNVGNLYPNSGIVLIRFGVRGDGLAPGLAEQVLSQAFGGSPDPAEPGDHFAESLVTGDFDADGFDDLVVGIPDEDDADEPGDTDSGAVQVYYGSVSGLDLASAQYFDEDTDGVPGGTNELDHFGSALATADFDGDGYDDLAIGIPYENVGFAAFGCGSVDVLYGTAAGLDTAGAQRFHQDFPTTMDGSCEVLDNWGAALEAADFDADGYADLAVGVPGENDGGGGVHFVFGNASGLAAARNNLWTQDDTGVLDTDELLDHFGASLVAADFTGDGYADLAIGAPGEDLELGGGTIATDAGAFHIFFGNAEGISSAGSWMWTQTSSTLGTSESGDLWSHALAAGDFDADGYADLAIGAPGEAIAGQLVVGEVTVLRGYPGGVTPSGGQVWNQDSPGIPGGIEQGDEFARALAAGDFDASGYADLAIGAPRESVIASGDGAAWVLYGSLFADGFDDGSTSRWSAAAP
jgi:hypothetical protein